eukprot:1942732-Pyramimonas_sp.AAC.4
MTSIKVTNTPHGVALKQHLVSPTSAHHELCFVVCVVLNHLVESSAETVVDIGTQCTPKQHNYIHHYHHNHAASLGQLAGSWEGH